MGRPLRVLVWFHDTLPSILFLAFLIHTPGKYFSSRERLYSAVVVASKCKKRKRIRFVY